MRKAKVNRKSIIKRLQDEKKARERGVVSLSLNLRLWERFKQACEDEGESASAVAEKLMEEFIDH